MLDRPAPSAAFVDRLLTHVAELPALRTFPGVDEIRARADRVVDAHPDTVRRRRIGTSRLGEPLHEYVLGEGPSVLVVGGVHPNEPIGFHTALHLLEDLAAARGPAAELGATWHVIPCIDPDGTRLNESWFTDPGDRVGYARGFYRPAPTEQVEWSFPLDHGEIYFDRPIPETLALMRIIDHARPAMIAGLHNGELGGVYYYLSRASHEMLEALHTIPARLGLPLDAGEPEVPDLVPFAPAVFPALSASGLHDRLVERGLDPAGHLGAGNMVDYSSRYGTLGFVPELPYWSHPASDDGTEAGERYADVLSRKAARLDELGRVLTEALDLARPHLTIESQLRRGAEAFTHAMRGIAAAERARAEDADARMATAAEVFSNDDVVHCFRLRFGSMLHRTLRAEVVAGTATPEVRRAAAGLGARLEDWYAEAASVTGLTTWPVERLVGVQYASTVAVAAAALSVDRDESEENA